MADLTEEDVLQILNLIEKSSFDYLQLQFGDLKLTVSKAGHWVVPTDQPGASAPAQPGESTRAESVKEPATKPPEPELTQPGSAAREDALPIVAPMVGTIYTTPEPGAPPYVQAGSHVDEGTTVGLIEIMKVFTAVKSGVRGSIAEICVQNGQFVEYGQTLFLVSPETPATQQGLSE